MERRAVALFACVALLGVAPARADHLAEHSPPDPRNRLSAITPKPAGTFDTIVLQYGPYVVGPGSDLTRADAEPIVGDFQVIAARPAVRTVDGEEPSDTDVHIHHAHWIKPNPSSSSGYDWFFGTGEEKTRGGGFAYMRADTETWEAGVRHAIPMRRGEAMGFISMLHNKTSQTLVLWIEGRFEIIWGSRDEIKAATAADPQHPLWSAGGGSPYTPDGIDVRPLTPVLHGRTFQVPKVGGDYVYPRDVGQYPGDPNAPIGVGHVWTAPTDGVIGIGAGHLHPGGKQVVVSNLGSDASPCADADADGFAGKTILRIDAYYRTDDDGAFRTGEELTGSKFFPSEQFQMGITQPGWRAYVRAGDRIAINGIYDARAYAYPDAMSFFGFYLDEEAPVDPVADACRVELVTDPDATLAQIVRSTPNRPWETHGHGAGGSIWCDPCDDESAAVTARGVEAPVVSIAGFAYLPGQMGMLETTGVPWVARGQDVTFVNEDWATGLVRHSVTTCAWPCNGPYRANHPFHDGTFDSGSLGATPVDTYETGTQAPAWTLDTTSLEPGLYAYYCRLHPWMRGALEVVEA